MDTISHRTVAVNGIKHVRGRERGGPRGPPNHGVPELWYTWRHQILSLSSRVYGAVAPDLRGYGDTEAPDDVRSYSILHIVGDLVALIDSLSQEQVFVVGHDRGATVAWNLCMLRPDRVKALVNLSVAFTPRNPKRKPLDSIRAIYGDDHYVCRFQELGAHSTLDWCQNKSTCQVHCQGPGPDLQLGGVKDYIHKGGFKRDVPFLQDEVVMEGVGHFINQERPNKISDQIYDFIQKFSELLLVKNL